MSPSRFSGKGLKTWSLNPEPNNWSLKSSTLNPEPDNWRVFFSSAGTEISADTTRQVLAGSSALATAEAAVLLLYC